MDPYKQLITLLYNNKYVYGDIVKIYAKNTECKYALRFVAGIIRKIGLGPLKDEPAVNETDFYTDTPIELIPDVYRFRFNTARGIIVADIRSLMDYTGDNLTSPYTTEEINDKDKYRYSKQCSLLKKFGWFISHDPLKSNDVSVTQLTVDTFSVLSQHHYVDYNWFTELTMKDLKNLYYLLNELWTLRLELSAEQKGRIVPSLECNNTLCPNYRSVKLYTDDMEDVLRTELLSILKLLLSGADQTACKEGGLYFLLGLVMVSPKAASSYPTLHSAANY
jgi:hypothetical protein